MGKSGERYLPGNFRDAFGRLWPELTMTVGTVVPPGKDGLKRRNALVERDFPGILRVALGGTSSSLGDAFIILNTAMERPF